MNLKDKISADLIDAMKSGDKVKLRTVRSIRALILEFEKSGTKQELNEEESIKLLTSAAKKRKESIEEFRKAGREEIAKNEEDELKVIMSYLPQQLNSEEVLQVVKKIAEQIGANSKSDFAKLMPVAIKELKGKADGKLVKEAVEKALS